ncbi:hypothetical protein pipiens_013849 [Culex pipiens pipiens]|uniref:Uncharacterized protein n=1 Tax=Culex pipiens pipiens TaxID=38569 RepID=A0ABD1CZA7_CULPP
MPPLHIATATNRTCVCLDVQDYHARSIAIRFRGQTESARPSRSQEKKRCSEVRNICSSNNNTPAINSEVRHSPVSGTRGENRRTESARPSRSEKKNCDYTLHVHVSGDAPDPEVHERRRK